MEGSGAGVDVLEEAASGGDVVVLAVLSAEAAGAELDEEAMVATEREAVLVCPNRTEAAVTSLMNACADSLMIGRTDRAEAASIVQKQ